MVQGFIVSNWKKKLIGYRPEDSYLIDDKNKIFAVADGVTRDCNNGAAARGGIKGALDILLYYPRQSPAKEASEIFCSIFLEVIKDFKIQNRNEKAIKEAFKETNEKIREWNQQNIPNLDYLINDFAGCTAAGAVKVNDIVYLGFIADCGVAIFDENGNLKFRTQNEGPHCKEKRPFLDNIVKRNGGWLNSEARKTIRNKYRNNPNEEYSFGVLTGQETAMHYVKTGTQEIKSEEHLIVYTDGLDNIIFSNEFSNQLRLNDFKQLKNLCQKQVKTEGTLIHSLN